jgi:hypothetical protein
MRWSPEDVLWTALVAIIAIAIGVFLGMVAFALWGPDTVTSLSLLR